MEDFALQSVEYFSNMDVEEEELPQRLQDLMDEIDTLSEEFDRVGTDEEAERIQAEIERLDRELLTGLKAFNASENSDGQMPSVDGAYRSADRVAENHDGEKGSNPYFWM